ncbi:C-3 sterol dehydrogenase/C-4 decarboxylase [Pyrenochaeta sp. MPI-SDFR-AT-0127]|nr:C-3 sterol dehydrogenase/C-4 decarboxylase [Pyrenochaeta sp. MPI-SDFR-AT-0127]
MSKNSFTASSPAVLAENLGTVLVIGGTGFLGSHIIRQLLAGNHAEKIVCASRNIKIESQQRDPRVVHHTLDVTSLDSIRALFSVWKPTTVLHTVSPPPRSHASVLEATNVNGTKTLLDAAKDCPETKAFIFTSSDSACHPSPFAQITEEECKLYTSHDAPNHYARTKGIADAIVLDANSSELRTATLRLPAIYGEGDTNFIPQIVESIQTGNWKSQVGPNDKIFEYVYVESAAEAHILAAYALLLKMPGADGQGFFITDGIAMPFFDFMRKCYAAAGQPVLKEEVKVIPFWVVRSMASLSEWLYWICTFGRMAPKMRRDDIDHLDTGCYWRIGKAEQLLGYKPVVEQDEAITRSMIWGMKHEK